MATGLTNPQEIPYPIYSDPVNIHADIQDMAERVNDLLTALQVPYLSLDIINDSGSTLAKGTPVYVSGYLNDRSAVSKCDADDINTFPCVGLLKAELIDGTEGIVVVAGLLENINTSSFVAGTRLYVSSSGTLTDEKPESGGSVVAIVAKSDTSGSVLVAPIKGGNGTWGSLKNGI